MAVAYNNDNIDIRPVFFTGDVALKKGYALCYDHDATAVANRSYHVEKPSFSNLNAFAGIVAAAYPAKTNGQHIKIVRPQRGTRGITAWTDQNVAASSALGLLPDQFALGRWMFGNQPVALSMEASDRSATAGEVVCQLGDLNVGPSNEFTHRLSHFNNFLGDTAILAEGATSAEVAAAGYTLVGTNATAIYGSAGVGELVLTPATTTIAQLVCGGGMASVAASLPFLLSTGRTAWFRSRYKSAAIDNDTFCGLAIDGSTISDGSLVGALDDYFGFISNGDTDGSLHFAYNKDNGTDRISAMSVSLVADTYVDLGFLVINRNSGTTASSGAKVIRTYNCDTGALVASIDASDLFNNDEGMHMAIAGIGGAAAPAITIDRWEAVMSI